MLRETFFCRQLSCGHSAPKPPINQRNRCKGSKGSEFREALGAARAKGCTGSKGARGCKGSEFEEVLRAARALSPKRSKENLGRV